MNKASTWVRKYLVPNFLLGREKAIAAFVAPLVVVRVAQWFGWTVDASMVQQVVYSALIALTVHQTANT
jgi:hypothetical protein